MQKVILFENGVESLSFFSMRLAEAFEKMGISVFVYDLENNTGEQVRRMIKFCKPGETFLVTFNFNGFRGEEEFYRGGTLIWKQLQLPCINIMVDHPFYYPTLLDKVKEELGTELYYQVAIDRDHQAFMKRFYPEMAEHVNFFPLAGSPCGDIATEREYDVVFVGNYTPPVRFRKYIERIDDEYTAFYDGIIADLIANPDMTMEMAFEKHLKRELGDISDADLRTCMGNMIFLDLYVRYYFRGDVVRTLAEADIPVHIWGAGFDLMECKKPENIIMEGATDSAGCLLALSKAKVALNVMPWFKDGSHDRVYSAMLNGAVCVTDESRYLKKEFTDGEDILFYSLKDYKNLSDRIRAILADKGRRDCMAEKAYSYAESHHQWRYRAQKLLDMLE